MIKFDSIITNGYVDIETIEERAKEGWEFVAILPAKQIDIHALVTDKITIFSKYVEDSKNKSWEHFEVKYKEEGVSTNWITTDYIDDIKSAKEVANMYASIEGVTDVNIVKITKSQEVVKTLY